MTLSMPLPIETVVTLVTLEYLKTQRFVWYDLYHSCLVCDDFYLFKISSYKSKEIVSLKICLIQILMPKVVTILQFTHSSKSNHTKFGYES